MATTRLIYPPTMKWTEEDERKYAHILSDDPPPVEVVSPERDERKLDAMPRTVVNIGTRNGVTTKVHFQDNESIIERQWDAERSWGKRLPRAGSTTANGSTSGSGKTRHSLPIPRSSLNDERLATALYLHR